jgi:N-acetylglutamate synthase-like GNAT family acetyltransferase
MDSAHEETVRHFTATLPKAKNRWYFMIHIRSAYPKDEIWINERYKELGFLPSDVGRELIAIAEDDEVRAGLGRLVPINADCAELGGIYVIQEFRGRGIATEVVSYLLHQGEVYHKIFCLPFAHLEHFYSGFGFHPCEDAERVPQEVHRKHQWCNRHYEHPTLLLVRSSSK